MNPRTHFSCGLVAMLLLASQLPAADRADVAPLAQAHAHNDYLHKRPLLDALDHGFNSVEADIFLVDGKLLVGHERSHLKPERTLQALYLDPLRERVRQGAGRVYPGAGRFNLLIDIKSAAEPTYQALDQVLADYADIVTAVRDGKLEPKAVDVVISGSRPRELLESQSLRFAGLDGRLSDLSSDEPASLIPLISDHWGTHFRWKGQGPISEAEHQKLDDIVAQAHAKGRKVRFWATPENEPFWRQMQASHVDLINTDNLAGLEKFLRSASGE